MSTSSSPVDIFRLDGKVAVVTGSGRGIGAAVATELGKRGAKVVVNYANSSEAANKVVEEIKKNGSEAIAIKADVGDVSQVRQLLDQAVEHFGKLDIVCSNSGVVSFGHLKDVTEEVRSLPSLSLSARLQLQQRKPIFREGLTPFEEKTKENT